MNEILGGIYGFLGNINYTIYRRLILIVLYIISKWNVNESMQDKSWKVI